MDFITGDIKQLYRKFLTASMASAMVMSIYSFVDTIAVGQSGLRVQQPWRLLHLCMEC